MKWLVHLLSVYMLLLSGIPCSGASDCCDDRPFQAAASNQPNNDAGPKPLSCCSPFFACGSCHSVVADQPAFELSRAFRLTSRVMYCDTDKMLFDYTSIIWQPPRQA